VSVGDLTCKVITIAKSSAPAFTHAPRARVTLCAARLPLPTTACCPRSNARAQHPVHRPLLARVHCDAARRVVTLAAMRLPRR